MTTTTAKENYSLRWNNHQNHILRAFDALLQTNSLVDVTLVCAERSIRAHKVVLSACSPFFQRVFNDTPCKHPVIVLKDFRGWLVQAIVDFMYRGEISVPQERLQQLIQAGESLQVRGLIDHSLTTTTTFGPVPPRSTTPNDYLTQSFEEPSIVTTTPVFIELPVLLNTTNTTITNNNNINLNNNTNTTTSSTTITTTSHNTTCLSPMPRRKQARPRRRSGEGDGPQDLSNGLITAKCEQEDLPSDTDEDDDDELHEITKTVKSIVQRSNGTTIDGIEHDANDDDDDDMEETNPMRDNKHRLMKVNDNNNNKSHRNQEEHINDASDDDDIVPSDTDEKENQPNTGIQLEMPENLCTKKIKTMSDDCSVPDGSLAGDLSDKNNNKDSDNMTREGLKKRARDEFHERFILSLKDLRHLNRSYRGGQHHHQNHLPHPHPFNDILSHLPLSPPPSFHMPVTHHQQQQQQQQHHHQQQHNQDTQEHDKSHLKIESDHSDSESFHDQLDHPMHQHQHHPGFTNSQANAAVAAMEREHQQKREQHHLQHQQQQHQQQKTKEFLMNHSPTLQFPPPFQQANDPGMRHGHHSSSPLSFPSMPSVGALTLTPPHLFGLDSPLGLFPPGMDPSKMYNPLMEMPDHHHHRNLHPDHHHQPFLKKKLSRPKGQHSAPRGGPPRSWTNAELTEALQHVWNKKMTTSQASRIFGIPYNSLLMYVRGKYGKSLKLEQLRKDCISGPPIELLQMNVTGQNHGSKNKDKNNAAASGGGSGGTGTNAANDDSSISSNKHLSQNERHAQSRCASSEPDLMSSPSPLFNPFPPGFYPDFPGAAAAFPGLQLSMLNFLPPDSRLHQQSMNPMVIDDDCKSENGSIQSLEDSFPTQPLALNNKSINQSGSTNSLPSASRLLYQN